MSFHFVSIPIGTIKALPFIQFPLPSLVVSIPIGTIKAVVALNGFKLANFVSIPIGTIKALHDSQGG